MADVTEADVSDDLWATSSKVREHLEIPQKGGSTDVQWAIESATDTVQAWWKRDTDQDIPEDLPDPNTLLDDHPLLVRATALLAAAEAHESKAQNIRDDEEADKKHAHLEHRAKKKFDDWVTVNGFGDTDTVQKQDSSPSVGRSSSLIDLGGD